MVCILVNTRMHTILFLSHMTYQWYLQLKVMWSQPKVRYHILFMILISMVSVFLIIEKEYWSGVLIVFSAFSIIDITKLRHQVTWDYQQWLVAPQSFLHRIIQLFSNYFFDLKLISFLLVALLLMGLAQYHILLLFVVLYACYVLQTMVLFTLSRRMVWVSVVTKLLYVFPFAIALILLISKFDEQALFVLNWTADFRFVAGILCTTIALMFYGFIQLKKRPFCVEEIVSNYNKNYWY